MADEWTAIVPLAFERCPERFFSSKDYYCCSALGVDTWGTECRPENCPYREVKTRSLEVTEEERDNVRSVLEGVRVIDRAMTVRRLNGYATTVLDVLGLAHTSKGEK